MRQAEVLVWAITAFCSTGDTSTCHGKYTWASMQLSVCCQHKGKTQQCTAPSQVLALGWAAWQGRAAAVMMQQHGVVALQAVLGCTQPVGHVLDKRPKCRSWHSAFLKLILLALSFLVKTCDMQNDISKAQAHHTPSESSLGRDKPVGFTCQWSHCSERASGGW